MERARSLYFLCWMAVLGLATALLSGLWFQVHHGHEALLDKKIASAQTKYQQLHTTSNALAADVEMANQSMEAQEIAAKILNEWTPFTQSPTPTLLAWAQARPKELWVESLERTEAGPSGASFLWQATGHAPLLPSTGDLGVQMGEEMGANRGFDFQSESVNAQGLHPFSLRWQESL